MLSVEGQEEALVSKIDPPPPFGKPLPNPCAPLHWQRCELCPHKDGALKRTDNGGEGGPEPRAYLLRSARPPEQGLGRQEWTGVGREWRLGFPSLVGTGI